MSDIAIRTEVKDTQFTMTVSVTPYAPHILERLRSMTVRSMQLHLEQILDEEARRDPSHP